MCEGSPRPANRSMAAVTGHGRRNMSSRFAYRGSLVMAFGTGSRSHAVVRKKCGCPICRSVTAAAIDRGRQMVCRLKGGYDSTAGGMALRTLRRRSSKNALHVAPLAYNLCVAACEREAGAAMIEFDVGATRPILGLCLARQHDAKPQDRRDESHSDHPPLTKRAMRTV